MKFGVLLILVLLALPGQARMYQWISPASGTTQLSGKPPSWYRGIGEGPRVIVFENGKIVDDTATRVPEWQRERMRAEAFGLSEVAPEEPGGVKELAEKLREIANSKEFLGSLVEQAEELEQKKEEPGPSTVESTQGRNRGMGQTEARASPNARARSRHAGARGRGRTERKFLAPPDR